MFEGRYQDAIRKFDEYLPISNYPAEKHRAMCDKADCWLSLGKKYEEASESLCEAIAFIPEYPDPYVKLGILAYNQKDWSMCKKWMNDAITRAGNTHLLFPLVAYNTYLPYDYLSIAYYNLGEIEKAYVCELKVFKYLHNDKRIIENIKFFEDALGLK
jgi:tetratricopeptide (TPR) repeat protein